MRRARRSLKRARRGLRRFRVQEGYTGEVMANFPVAVITDEFTQDFERICKTAVELDVPALEVRTVWDRNIVDLSDDQVRELRALADRYGRKIVGIASPVFKCVHPDGGAIDERFQQDAFKAAHTFADQPKVLRRAVEIANMLDAPLVRVFSFWRTVEPQALRGAIIESLEQALQIASPRGVTIGLENEHACNLSTAAEVRPVLDALPHTRLGLVWDPANSSVSGHQGYPDDYLRAPADRIVHVHAKDGFFDDGMQWCVIGEGSVDWAGQLRALVEDGYAGMVSGDALGRPDGDKFRAACLRPGLETPDCGGLRRGGLSAKLRVSMRTVLLTAMAGILMLGACGGGGDEDGALTIAVIPMGTTHEHWKAIHAGAVKAGRELGVEIVWKGPQKEDDREQQIAVIEDMVARRADGIVLAPLDRSGLRQVVREAKAAGIPPSASTPAWRAMTTSAGRHRQLRRRRGRASVWPRSCGRPGQGDHDARHGGRGVHRGPRAGLSR